MPLRVLNHEKTLSDESEGGDRISPQKVADDDEVHSVEPRGVECTPPKYRIPYSEVCPFGETGDILTSSRKNYKASVSVGLMANKIHPVERSFAIHTGWNLMLQDVFEAESLKPFKASNRPSLENTVIQKAPTVLIITLHVKCGENRHSVVSGTVCSLPLPVLLRTSFIIRF